MTSFPLFSSEIDPFCAAPFSGTNSQGVGTQRMVARLQEILRQANPRGAAYLSADLLEELRRASLTVTNVRQAVAVRAELPAQLLRAGRSLEALQEFDALEAFMQANRVSISPGSRSYLHMRRGLAWLRLGEQENCLLNHSAESCLLPIQGTGLHQLPRGSRGAIEQFTALLRENPANLEARWLLNIAHMTLGEWPEKVPAEWVIPPAVFASQYSLPRFPEAAAAAGIDVDDLAGGAIADDFDGDGLLDLMSSSWSLRGPLRFFRNNGDGTFVERTREAGLAGLTGSLNMMQTDYNNDGYLDVYMLRGAWLGQGGQHPNSLLRNNGNGTFEDVTAEAGLLSPHPSQTATWFDFDGDGWLDLFIGNESSEADLHPCELYRNNGNGTFTECAAASGLAATGFVKGVASGDYNNDGRPDLYISCRGEFNVLLRNDGPGPGHSPARPVWRFTDVTDAAGVAEPRISFPTWFFDYDNDGHLDIFVSGYSATLAEIAADYLGLPHPAERARLYRNKGDGTFADVTKDAGLYKVLHTMGCNYGDFDNDGWLDFYLGTGDPDFTTLVPNRAFRNDGGARFQEVTTALGMGHLQKGHAIAFADFDNDGDQDVFADMGGAYSGDNYRNALFVNPGNAHHWLTLKLEGTRSNRSAIGARIRVVVQTSSGLRSIYKTVSSGGSFGASPLRQEIGLGAAAKIEFVEILWPGTGKTQRLSGLTMDHIYRVREGSDRVEPLSPRRFQLATKPAASRHDANAHHHLIPPARP